MTREAREIIEVLAEEADRAGREGGWSVVALQALARCAQNLIRREQSASAEPQLGGA